MNGHIPQCIQRKDEGSHGRLPWQPGIKQILEWQAGRMQKD